MRQGTTAQWGAADTALRFLASGEFGYDTTTGTLKIGDGSTTFAALPEIGAGGAAFDGTLTNADLTIATVGFGLNIKSGADSRAGTAVLVDGAASVSTNALGDLSLVFLSILVPGGTPGALYVNGKASGFGFDIASTSALDDSEVSWMIVDLV